MAETQVLKAQVRERSSKGALRLLRQGGLVPAVIYGEKQPASMIAVPTKQVTALYNKGAFLSHTLDIEVDGQKTRVIPRDIQLDPVRDFVVHVDFLRVGAHSTIHVAVPVHFVNQDVSPGLKAGGVLNIVQHEIELICSPDAIPESIDIDVSKAELGESIHISHVTLPKGTAPAIADRDFTIATIAAPAGLVSEQNAAEDAAAEAAKA